MSEKLTSWHALIIPAVALSYAGYSIWEHLTFGYARLTVQYGMMLNICLVGFALASVARTLVGLRLRSGNREVVAGDEGAGDKTNLIRTVLILAGAWVGVLIMPYLGYAITFAALILFGLIVMGVRSPYPIIAIAAGMVGIIHFGFVRMMGLGLPAGILG